MLFLPLGVVHFKELFGTLGEKTQEIRFMRSGMLLARKKRYISSTSTKYHVQTLIKGY